MARRSRSGMKWRFKVRPRVRREDVLSVIEYRPETGEFIWRKWCGGRAKAGTIAGHVFNTGYRCIQICGHITTANRWAWFYITGKWPTRDVDHINGVRSDDRWANLRLATRSQNCANGKAKSGNRSGFKGVRRDKNRWVATIMVQGRSIYLGRHSTPEQAHAAYMKAAEKHFGEFARAA